MGFCKQQECPKTSDYFQNSSQKQTCLFKDIQAAQRGYYLLFLDVKKAFDKLRRTKILEKIEELCPGDGAFLQMRLAEIK